MTDFPDLAALLGRHHDSLREYFDDRFNQLQQEIRTMSATTTNSLASLQAAVANETTVDQSIIALVTNMAAQIQAASPSGDNPAIDALVTQIQSNAASLSALVTQNTPAPAAPPGPVAA